MEHESIHNLKIELLKILIQTISDIDTEQKKQDAKKYIIENGFKHTELKKIANTILDNMVERNVFFGTLSDNVICFCIDVSPSK